MESRAAIWQRPRAAVLGGFRALRRFDDASGWCLQLIIVLTSVAFGYVSRLSILDDPWITFRYARNLATGNGLVYNIGEHYLGISGPLFAILLGILAIPNPDSIPTLAAWVTIISLAATCIGMYWYAKIHDAVMVGFLAAMAFAANPLTAFMTGFEAYSQLGLLIWAFVAYSSGRGRVTGALLALSILTRPDAIAAAVVVACHCLWRKRDMLKDVLMSSAIVLAPFLIGSLLYFHSPLPGTAGAKIAQTQSHTFWVSFAPGLLAWVFEFTRSRGYSYGVFAASPLLGSMTIWKYRFWHLPVLCLVLQATAYEIGHIAFYPWYVAPLIFVAAIFMGVTLDTVVTIISRWFGTRQWGIGVAASLALVSLTFSTVQTEAQAIVDWPRMVLYHTAGHWMKANLPSDASVGYVETGVLGYTSNLYWVDPLGLVNAGLESHVATGDFNYGLRTYRPQYILTSSETSIGNPGEESWFGDRYRLIHEVNVTGASMSVYERYR